MILKNIIYLDNSIKLCCVKTKKEEIRLLLPERVQDIIISYSIGLVNNPSSRVKETIKIEKENIRIIDNYILISFYLDELLKPKECEITVNSLSFFLKDKPRYEVQIGKTQAFRNIESDRTIIDNILKKVKASSNSLTNVKSKHSPKDSTKNASTKPYKNKLVDECDINVEDIKHFITSYEKFKSQIQDSDIYELLKNKPSTVDFNLKKFGISLLCKLLLLIKYVNELVDNDFQKDLHEFLRTQILEKLKTEVTA